MLLTMPSWTGSLAVAKMMGIVVVCGLRHSGDRRPAPSHQHFHLSAHQFCCKSRQAIVLSFAKTRFDL